MTYPDAFDPSRVGQYPVRAFAGGGYVWDEVLEYRVWCGPAAGSDDGDQCLAFATYAAAKAAYLDLPNADEPLALILQREFIDEPEPGDFRHIKDERITEWPVEFLARPRRDDLTIPNFLAPDAPPDRLQILRGEASRP